MLARILSRVLFPDPLRPTMPKNSPWRTSKEMSCRTRCSRYSTRESGCATRSLRESMRCAGIRNVLSIPRASTTTGADAREREAARPPASSSVVGLVMAGATIGLSPMQVADTRTLRRQAPALPIVAVVTVLGAVLRLLAARDALFADELSTYWIVTTHGLGGVLSTVHSNAEITPPLYFVAAW